MSRDNVLAGKIKFFFWCSLKKAFFKIRKPKTSLGVDWVFTLTIQIDLIDKNLEGPVYQDRLYFLLAKYKEVVFYVRYSCWPCNMIQTVLSKENTRNKSKDQEYQNIKELPIVKIFNAYVSYSYFSHTTNTWVTQKQEVYRTYLENTNSQGLSKFFKAHNI